MLKRISVIIGTLVTCALLFLFLHSNFGFNPNYSVAVIYSNSDKFDSSVKYYDENLNLLFTRKLFLASLTKYGRLFVDLGEKKYMLSDGTYWVGCPDAIELDTNTGKIKKYYADANCSLAMAANNKYVFTTWSAFDAYIHRCDKKTIELKKMTIPGSCHSMYAENDNILYAFGGDSHRGISNLYIIDAEKLEILKTFDIKDKGCYQEECMKIGDDFYFLNYARYADGNKSHSTPCQTLTRFNTKTYEFKDIDLGFVPFRFTKFKNWIFISDNERSSRKLAIYDTKTDEVETKELDHHASYMAVDEKNKKLYALGDGYLCKYDLPSFKLIKKIDCLGNVVFTK